MVITINWFLNVKPTLYSSGKLHLRSIFITKTKSQFCKIVGYEFNIQN